MNKVKLYADLEDPFPGVSTVPAEIVVTTSRPDFVIVHYRSQPATVTLVELTIPFSTGIEAARSRKLERYEFLEFDITRAGYQLLCTPGHHDRYLF